jgi:hypothetical protein
MKKPGCSLQPGFFYVYRSLCGQVGGVSLSASTVPAK